MCPIHAKSESQACLPGKRRCSGSQSNRMAGALVSFSPILTVSSNTAVSSPCSPRSWDAAADQLWLTLTMPSRWPLQHSDPALEPGHRRPEHVHLHGIPHPFRVIPAQVRAQRRLFKGTPGTGKARPPACRSLGPIPPRAGARPPTPRRPPNSEVTPMHLTTQAPVIIRKRISFGCRSVIIVSWSNAAPSISVDAFSKNSVARTNFPASLPVFSNGVRY
jgi:hypothetical protein